jgi:uncharacterized protein YecE (DUF72 family)
VAARFWIGTSGWNYKHWRGTFYPRDLPVKRWFAYYAERFPTVEINNSFYREPSVKTYEGWRDQAPPGFRYAVKAHRYVTHMKRLTDTGDSLDRVITGARRLGGSLGPVLFQCHPQFDRDEENCSRLERFLEALPRDLDCAFEFRHRSWNDDAAAGILRRHGVAFVCHDMGGEEWPLVPTAKFAYARFHGAGSKYGGDYPKRLLEEYAERFRRLAGDVDSVWAYFNNDIGGYAPRNAETLMALLCG